MKIERLHAILNFWFRKGCKIDSSRWLHLPRILKAGLEKFIIIDCCNHHEYFMWWIVTSGSKTVIVVVLDFCIIIIKHVFSRLTKRLSVRQIWQGQIWNIVCYEDREKLMEELVEKSISMWLQKLEILAYVVILGNYLSHLSVLDNHVLFFKV